MTEEGDKRRATEVGVPALWTPELATMFGQARDYMDAKREKDEEIIRISKDVTWESKRIIYNLHTFISKEKSVPESRGRLLQLMQSDRHFRGMAKALVGEDLCLHHKRYTHCTQEYIEAFVFLYFLEKSTIPSYQEVQESLNVKWTVKGSSEEPEEKSLQIPVTVTDYVLGVLDFTGELMKATVPTLSRPNLHSFLVLSFRFVREFYAELVRISSAYHLKIFYGKLRVLQQSVIKIETTVYKLKMKILLTGKLPDTRELAQLQQTFYQKQIGERNNEDAKDDGDVENVIDSGVE